ncbi:hypothetical protein [Sphingopyxis lindanitolerans]|nr:hypothetical protein [Sphingopyxis lindanitolerans]
MARVTPETNWLQRLWSSVIEASAAAVAVHYHAPWGRATSR